jgi:hypothetical protein
VAGGRGYIRSVRRPRRRLLTAAVVPLAALAVLAVAACGETAESDDTMAPIQGAPGDTGGTTPTMAPVATTTPVSAGSDGATAGFVSVTVQVASEGIDETLALDRAGIATLDPLNLNASCTALDGGDPVALSVIDLRRLATGSQLLSVVLRTDEPATAPGEYPAHLEIADAEQVTTTYDVTLMLDEGGSSGTFQGTDEAGNVASGSFVCAAQPVDTTTTIPPDPGEEVVEETG